MSTIALIDTRLKIPGESIGTVVSTHDTIRAAFKANEAFQKRMRDSGVKDHVPTKNDADFAPELVTFSTEAGATLWSR
jgi:hypothetical protein